MKGLLIILIACSFAIAEINSEPQTFKNYQYFSFEDKSWHNVNEDELLVGTGTNGYIGFIKNTNITIPLTICQYRILLQERLSKIEKEITDIQNNVLISRQKEQELVGDSINTERFKVKK